MAMSNRPSIEELFSTYGLQRALNATIRLPSIVDQTETQLKDEKYRMFVDERHEVLLTELDSAREEYERVSEGRDTHDDLANPMRATQLNREYLQASIRYNKAESEYRVFTSDIAELRSVPEQMTRDEATLWNAHKLKEKHDRENADGPSKTEMQLTEMYQAKLRQLQAADKCMEALERKDRVNAELLEMNDVEIANVREKMQQERLEFSYKRAQYRAYGQRLHGAMSELKKDNQQLRAQIEGYELCGAALHPQDSQTVSNGSSQGKSPSLIEF